MRATITRNFRDVNTISPKVLLTNVVNDDGSEFRDHCWVDISNEIEGFIPKTNRYKVTVEFTASVKSYQTRGPKKDTLCKMVNIKKV